MSKSRKEKRVDKPVGDSPAAKAEKRPRAVLGSSLLLVDDDQHILKSMRIFLELEHFRVRTAGGGQEAMQRVGEELPDLIVLDVMMPEMDGFAVLEKLQDGDHTHDIPVIMLTAKGQDADVLRGFKKGAASYMTKPVNFDELVDNIRLILEDKGVAASDGKSKESRMVES